MDVLIVIVNYRVSGLVVDCLRSLVPEVAERPGVRVVVTDNASGDDSVTRLEAAVRENGWESWVEVRPLERNGGFAYGNNAAIQPVLAGPESERPNYIWLLNPDTIVLPGAIAALIAFMETHSEVGLVGSRVENPDRTQQTWGHPFPSVLLEFERGMGLGALTRLLYPEPGGKQLPHPGAAPVDWVSGASLFVRRAVFDAVGILDEGYFMYFEEVDFCLRARRAGWTCWYVPAAGVVHFYGQSADGEVANTAGKRIPSYWFASRRRYFRKHHGLAATVLADVLWTVAHASFRVRKALTRQPTGMPPRLFRDFVRYNFLGARS